MNAFFIRKVLKLYTPHICIFRSQRKIRIGEPYHSPSFMGAKRRLIERQDTYQYVPLLPSLCSLLSDPSILDEVQQCQFRIHNDGVLEDVCDGSIFKEHPLFAYDPYALQIIAFLDEVELCNPLGTHFKKHKLAIVLFNSRQYSSQASLIT